MNDELVKRLHDRLGACIDQVGHPDYSLRELVTTLREIKDEMFTALSRQEVPTEDIGRSVKPHRSGGGHWVEPFGMEPPKPGTPPDNVSAGMPEDPKVLLRWVRGGAKLTAAGIQKIMDYADALRVELEQTEFALAAENERATNLAQRIEHVEAALAENKAMFVRVEAFLRKVLPPDFISGIEAEIAAEIAANQQERK